MSIFILTFSLFQLYSKILFSLNELKAVTISLIYETEGYLL